MLAILNSHSRDKRIIFEEKDHRYTIDGIYTDFTSTTTFIKKFFNEFDADKVISQMIRFGSFARKYPDKTPDQVKQEWKDSGINASDRGSRLHRYIEYFYNGLETAPEEIADLDLEVEMFYNFISALEPRLVPFRTEWYIFDEEYKIAGSIDMLFQTDPVRAPRNVAIYDWKCSKEIKLSNRYGKARSPIAHLDDCNGNHYSLQLNMYKYILEKNYGMNVVDMNLVVIHKNHDNFFLVNIKNMQEEIRNMLAAIKRA
jgi:ATP-dependent exoDNAse (exonuclease V) beta subunit